MTLIKSKSTIEYIHYFPSKKTKSKFPIGLMKKSKKKTRLFNVILGIILGVSIGLLIKPKFKNFVKCTLMSSSVPVIVIQETSSVGKNMPSIADNKDPYEIINISKDRSIRDNEDSLLFVGVMTANKYLTTRATAVYETWAQNIPGRVAFFSSQSSMLPENHINIPLIKLKGVDDRYPPQKKSFMMLEYMWEHYGNHFEWFMRADDDVYVRSNKLARLLRSVDSSKPQFIGQAGRGNQEEFGLLSLEYDENFCMGGPGIIMSRATLAKVAPHIKYCLKNLYTTHEDVELGRCVQKFAGIPCTWSYEMQHILYHNSSGKDSFSGNLKVKEVHRAMTLHPIKRHIHMYRIHNYMRGLEIHDLQQEMLHKHRDLNKMTKLLGMSNISIEDVRLTDNVPLFNDKMGSDKYLGDSYLLGKEPSLIKPPVVPSIWNFISRSMYSASNLNPKKKLESHIKEGLDDVIREVMENLNKFSRERGRVIEFKELLYGYYRENPLYGTDYILDLLLVYKKYRGKKMTVPVRKHTYVQKQFTGIEIREMGHNRVYSSDNIDNDSEVDDDDEIEHKELEEEEVEEENILSNSHLVEDDDDNIVREHNKNKQRHSQKLNNVRINFIMGLSGRYDTFKRFLDNFESVCMKNENNVKLFVILFPNTNNDFAMNQTMNLINQVNNRYQINRRYNTYNDEHKKIHVVPVFDTFSRAKAMEIGASQVKYPYDLLFFIDVDIMFTVKSLDRIRMNTIRHHQVYYPIVFSQYDPKIVYNLKESPNHFHISQKTGYWRSFGFGIAACFKSDLVQIGGFDTSITGWGKEDVDVFDKFVQNQNITIFRAPDPDLIHVYHTVECDKSLEPAQYKMCTNSRSETLAGVQELGNFMFKNKKHFIGK